MPILKSRLDCRGLLRSKNGANLQQLAYTYDKASDLTAITDTAHVGSGSGTKSQIVYDDLHRIASLQSTSRGAITYTYDSLGNVNVNTEFGGGTYQYGIRPHAVTSANGVNYDYDACGNMKTRGNQTLTYDERNQLIQVTAPGSTVSFGYDDGGERLWRKGAQGYSIWIGGIYEINAGKILCHVFAEGQRIATFEPACNAVMSAIVGEHRWYVASTALRSMLDWPFQQGRGPLTLMSIYLSALLAICLRERRRLAVEPRIVRTAWRPATLWRQAITFTCLVTFLFSGIPNAEAATFNPVFYYYHPDHLGSANVITDSSGHQVQHFEYSAFGVEWFKDNNDAYPISNRYTDQVLDDETGLYYYGSRYYDSHLGRFIQPDTEIQNASDPQMLNRYSYVRNSPLVYRDPSGHEFSGGSGGLEFGSGGSVSYGGADGVSVIRGTILWSDNMNINFDFARVSMQMWVRSGSVEFTGQFSYIRSLFFDDRLIFDYAPPIDLFDFVVRHPSSEQPQPETSAAHSGSSGGGWLSSITSAAGWLAMLPLGPISTIAGVVNAAGEWAQGHKMEAAIALGGAASAVFGAGALAQVAKATKGGKVFRELSVLDRARLDSGLGLIPRGSGGTIADQVAGEATQFISASETVAGTAIYKGGNGLVTIDIDLAVKGGAGYVPHNNVMQAVGRSGTGELVRNAKRAREVMFKVGSEIPADAVKIVKQR